MKLILPQILWGRLNKRSVASVFSLAALSCTIQTDGQNIVTSLPPSGTRGNEIKIDFSWTQCGKICQNLDIDGEKWRPIF